MNKARIRRYYHLVSSISYWWFVAVCVAFSLIALVALRNNNQTMIRLREAVFTADKEKGDVEGALRELRGFVHGHMNSDLASGPNAVRPPIQLKYLYDRLLEEEKNRVTSVNSNLYNQAQVECERRFPQNLTTSGRIPCIKEFVDRNSTKERPIPDDLYKFDFISPRWSPDLAGWSIVIAIVSAIVSAILFVNRLAAEYWLRYELHK
jgi:hypothetical protein